jgi:hypothetical protein
MMYETWNTRKWLVAHDNMEKNKARKKNTIIKAWNLTQNKPKQVQNMTNNSLIGCKHHIAHNSHGLIHF